MYLNKNKSKYNNPFYIRRYHPHFIEFIKRWIGRFNHTWGRFNHTWDEGNLISWEDRIHQPDITQSTALTYSNYYTKIEIKLEIVLR